ncbi:hypothetical protein Pelo_17614 [Pelomyxa schiedti]|nr:hypothetical protein Pelo_17614 [Pelomyxa schiedti]
MMKSNHDGSTTTSGADSTVGVWGRSTDQIAALVFGGHPRCGSRLTPGARLALAADGSLVARLLWAFVTDTATNLVFGEVFDPSGRPRARPHAFSLSPLLQSVAMGPRPHPQGGVGVAGVATWWVSPTRWVLHDNNEGRGGGGGGGGGCLLWAARDGLLGCYAACDVNGKWFVASVAECEGEGDAMVRDRCGGMVGVVIMSMRADAQPDGGRVIVPISGGAFDSAEYFVRLLSFSKPSEMLAVVARKDGTENRFILFDVGGAYKSKSLVIASETRALFPPGYVVSSAMSMERTDGSHCFIVYGKAHGRARRVAPLEITEVSERTGVVKLLSEGREKLRNLYRVSDSRFCVSLDSGDSLCEIWDCSGGTTALVMCVPGARMPEQHKFWSVAAAESGFIFTVERHQLKVIEASSGVVVLLLPLPEILGLDGVWALP